MPTMKELRRVAILALLIIVTTSLASAQTETATPSAPQPAAVSHPNNSKLYLEEIARLKEQRSQLAAENEALKQSLIAQQQQTAQLQADLTNTQSLLPERDQQVASAQGSLDAANQRANHWKYATEGLIGLLSVIMLAVLLYQQRDELVAQLRKLSEYRLVRAPSEGKIEADSVREFRREKSKPITKPTKREPSRSRQQPSIFDDSAINPDEVFDRLYGQRKAS